LNADAEVVEQFTPAQRRVRLVRGEAHFTVTKNPARPFIVEAGGVGVRAVGTAFNVRLDAATVEVLVTEGRVQVASPTAVSARAQAGPPVAPSSLPVNFSSSADPAPAMLGAGQRAIVGLSAEAPPPQIATVSSDEMARLLAWQGLRLQFQDMPLDKVAREFNRYSHTQLRVAESAADVLVAGIFRADNVDVFVQFLEEGFRIRADRLTDGTVVLSKAQ